MMDKEMEISNQREMDRGMTKKASDARERVDELIGVRNSLLSELERVTEELRDITGMIESHFNSPVKGY